VNHKKLFLQSWEDRAAVRRRGGQAALGSGGCAAKGARDLGSARVLTPAAGLIAPLDLNRVSPGDH
jgi:hypothetical protein